MSLNLGEGSAAASSALQAQNEHLRAENRRLTETLRQYEASDLAEIRAIEAERVRLAESEREARAANDAKDTFIAMLSHELRTPLTPVLAATSALMQRQDLPTAFADLLTIIVRNLTAEVQLIDDLLDLTRITHGKMRVDKRPVDLHRVVRDVLDAQGAEVERAELALSLELSAPQSWVNGDPTRLEQVFNNLLRNAMKFTPPGGRIEVRSWNRDELLLLEVADNGRGIAGSALHRLFQPFEQALHENMGSAKGLGLGLPISRGILEQHEAQISASSPGLGRGASFVIEIGTIEPPSCLPPPSSAPPQSASRRVRVLLVEDHADTAEVFQELLSHYGYSVQVATSVESALAIEASTFDVLLSDVGLSDGSGLDLLRAMRKTRHVPAIALSGFGTEDDIRASKEAGFAVHLTKPVDFAEVLTAIAQLELS